MGDRDRLERLIGIAGMLRQMPSAATASDVPLDSLPTMRPISLVETCQLRTPAACYHPIVTSARSNDSGLSTQAPWRGLAGS